MSVTIYGAVLIVYSAYTMLKTKENKGRFIRFLTLSVFLNINITIGYVLKVGTQTVAGYFLITLFAGIWGLSLIRRIPQNIAFKALGLSFCLIMGLGLIPFMKYQIVDSRGWDYYLFGNDNITTHTLGFTQLKELIKAFAFIFILESVHSKLEVSDWVNLINNISSWSKIILIYDCVEFIAVYILGYKNMYSTFLQPIFGLKDSTYTTSLARGRGYQLQGMFTEPSAYAVGLFMIILLLVMQLKLSKTGDNPKKICPKCTYFTIAICLILMIFSMSFTGILLIALLSIIYLTYIYTVHRKYRRLFLISIPLLMFGIICVMVILVNTNSYYGERLASAFVIMKQAVMTNDLNHLYFQLISTANDGSSVSRLGSLVGTLKMEFLQNPILGIGVGGSNSYSFIGNLLTDLGLLGAYFWMSLLVFEYNIRRSICFYIVLLTILIASIVFVPISTFGTDAILLIYLLEQIYSVPVNIGSSQYNKNGRRT